MKVPKLIIFTTARNFGIQVALIDKTLLPSKTKIRQELIEIQKQYKFKPADFMKLLQKFYSRLEKQSNWKTFYGKKLYALSQLSGGKKIIKEVKTYFWIGVAHGLIFRKIDLVKIAINITKNGRLK